MRGAGPAPARWPAVLNVAEATEYLGRRESLLFALVAAGYLEPFTNGHRATVFLRSSVDAALAAVRMNGGGDALEVPPGVASVAAARAWFQKSKDQETARQNAKRRRA